MNTQNARRKNKQSQEKRNKKYKNDKDIGREVGMNEGEKEYNSRKTEKTGKEKKVKQEKTKLINKAKTE